MHDKQALRQKLRKFRELFDKENLFWPGGSYPEGFRAALAAASVVAGYEKLGSEVDPALTMECAARMGKIIALPWMADRKASLAFRRWDSGAPLETAPFGFRQPLAAAPIIAPDVILTPLVGFDRKLNRLGQGAGHYDRAFANHPDSLRIGLAWSVQETDELAPDPWDVPLDAVLTEKEWITAPHSRIGA